MATVLQSRPAGRVSGILHAAGLPRLFHDTLDRVVAAWRRYRIERELESLSYDQRKDMGFRAQDENAR